MSEVPAVDVGRSSLHVGRLLVFCRKCSDSVLSQIENTASKGNCMALHTAFMMWKYGHVWYMGVMCGGVMCGGVMCGV